MRKIYLFLVVVGTILPYYIFSQFLITNDFDFKLIVTLLFDNPVSSSFVADFLLSCFVFIIFMFNESRKYNIKEKWICLVVLFVTGLSAAFPLFLYFRHSYINRSAHKV
ncbi:DUF2834 domain-containing protein [Marininema halotolerans]|uniref:DUF2834 domain-containing protein n=1 Tax=Marininema halotolerans TaxID=1155944 RepID=A0A1I6P2F1_9BACL|nr:DUF2834 domain-containing protein [Marininema halotolerans]SFS34396.1 Protein of unknown function [Marininema halotolerans]